jgi:XTP/dITP diphosphohydrolase
MQNWEELKLRKKKRQGGILGGVPRSLPAMVKAYRVGEKAASSGFDWEQKEDVWAKVKEEIAEIEAEMAVGNHERTADEIGDLFFALINMCRLYGIDPELALEKTNKKFISRFQHMEAEAGDRLFTEMSAEELDQLWRNAKKEER